MASEIRVNKINNRAGLGTITIADTGVVVNGIVTCTEVSGLNVLNIAGVSTFASTLDINGDIDVDGHTNLDNLSVAGVSTFNDNVRLLDGDRLQFGNSQDISIFHNGSHTLINKSGSGTGDLIFNIDQVIFKDTTGSDERLATNSKGIKVGTGVTIETNGQATYTGIVTASSFKLSDGSNVGGVESDAQFNTLSGTNAGDSFSGTNATGNTLIGYNAGTAITTADNQTFIGYNCGASVSSEASIRTAVGYEAMKNATGQNGNAFGRRALYSHTASSENDGSNSAFGTLSQYLNVSGAKNSSFGNNTLQNLTTGDENTCVGMQAGQNLTTGSRNTFLGKGAGNGGGAITGDNNICIGYEVDPLNLESNTVTIGDANIYKLRVPGIGLTFTTAGAIITGIVTATSFVGDGSSLSNLPAGAPVGGASTNTVFFENDKEVAVNYQITSTKNAMSAGPIAINAGIAVTVPSGCAWTIV